jgi:GINS complex subunit 1
MNNCLRGRELLLDLQRSDFLPPWDEEGVRTVSNEMADMYVKLRNADAEYRSLSEASTDTAKAYYGLCIMRNRRYLYSYVMNRLRKVSHLRWEIGAVIPDVISHDILSVRENLFFSKYSDIVSEYILNSDLDLCSALEV